jgi:Fe2+ or Zn2+ uptake regulation protein
MGRSENPATELADHGLRATRQRIAVLRLLRRARNHPTAAELHRRLLQQQPKLSLKTVYDTLDSLVSAGLAASVTHAGAPHRYDGNTASHYHAQCQVCGALTDVPANADRQIRGRTPLPDGFEIEEIRVTLLGRCPRCREDN